MSDLDVGHMPWLGGPLSVSQTRLLGCDCFLSTVLLDDHGAPLDAKPGKRLVNAEQRVALIARDRGCAFPRLHVRARLDGCAPYPALGERWPDGDEQPGPAVPFTSPTDAPEIRVRREMGNPNRRRQQTLVHPAALDRPPGSNPGRRTPPSKPEGGSNLFGDNRTRPGSASDIKPPIRSPQAVSRPQLSTTHDVRAGGRKTDLPNNSQTCRARARSNLSRPAATGSPSALLMRYFTVFRCRFM